MTDKPRRAHVLDIVIGANSRQELADALRLIATDIERNEMSSEGCSGAPSSGWHWNYDVDETWTKERYFEALDELLAA